MVAARSGARRSGGRGCGAEMCRRSGLGKIVGVGAVKAAMGIRGGGGLKRNLKLYVNIMRVLKGKVPFKVT